MNYYISIIMCSVLIAGCSSSSLLEQKSTRALREAFEKEQAPDASMTVLVTTHGVGDKEKKELSLCGVSILVATPSVVTMIGTRAELECVAEKPFVKSLELSGTKKTQ